MSSVPSVLSMLAAISGLGSAAFTVRWLFNRYDALGRPNGFPMISVGLLLVLTIAAAHPGYARHRQGATLSAAASVISGAHVEVHCQTAEEAALDAGSEAGYVKAGPDGLPEHVAYIKWEQCKQLRSYQRSDKHHPTTAQYEAVHVLTHEAVHTSGVTSESLTECMAVQRDAITAGELGASAEDARALAWHFWKLSYPYMRDSYRDAGCTRGGALDENLKTSPWVAGA